MENPRARIAIEAPLDLVWAIMLDTDRYAEWNPFIERAETQAPPHVGNRIVLHVRWSDGGTARSPERISVVEPPNTVGQARMARLSYVYEGLPSRLRLLRGTRHQRLTQSPDGATVYDTIEEFSGPLVRFAGPERVADGFRRHAQALKVRAKSQAR